MIKKMFSEPNRVIKRETLKLYSFDLKGNISCVEPRIAIQFEMCNHPLELDNVQYETVEERIASGNLIFVARYRSRVVGYLFISTAACEVGEIEDMLTVHTGEVYFYDAFTCPGFRRNRIYQALLLNACQYFKDRAYSFALIFTKESNVNSKKGIEGAGFSCYQVIQFANRFGEKSWNYSSRSCDVQSRFGNEN